MKLKDIYLNNFRNYGKLKLELNEQINIISGANAQGKTNLLEAIYYLAFGKSFRGQKDHYMVKWNQTHFFIKGQVEQNKGSIILENGFDPSNNRKILKINGQKQQVGRVHNYYNVVIFNPEDLDLVKGAPAGRRHYLDWEISQCNPLYYDHLKRYRRVLDSRNLLLKKRSKEIDIWDEQLINHGSKLIYKRFDFIQKLNPMTRLIHRKISNETEELEIKYLNNFVSHAKNISVEEIAILFKEKLQLTKNDELARGYTLVGPHRDDLLFLINKKEVKAFGSQGQHRSVVLSLKLAELEIIKGHIGEYPILLLDDVLSELDSDRRKFLFKGIIDRVQTFITTTDVHLLDEKILAKGSTFTVVNGLVEGG